MLKGARAKGLAKIELWNWRKSTRIISQEPGTIHGPRVSRNETFKDQPIRFFLFLHFWFRGAFRRRRNRSCWDFQDQKRSRTSLWIQIDYLVSLYHFWFVEILCRLLNKIHIINCNNLYGFYLLQLICHWVNFETIKSGNELWCWSLWSVLWMDHK